MRNAHIHADDVDEILVDHARILVFQQRDLQPFGIDVAARAAQRAADIEPMRHAAGKPRQHALMEHRHGQRDVVEMAAGGIGVVGDEDVARRHLVEPEMPDLLLHRLGHAANEHRQAEPDRHRLALRREQPGREIQRLIDDDVVCRAHEIGLHLAGNGDDRIAHDLGDDGIGGGGGGGGALRVHCW